MNATVCVSRSKDKLWELIVSFHHVAQTEVIRFVSKHLLNHLTGPENVFLMFSVFFFKVTKAYFWCNTFGVNIACNLASWISAVVGEGSYSCL